ALRMAQAFLPLMHTGLRRLCFVSSEAGSVAVGHRGDGYSYTMSKTALNMGVRLLFNQLQPQGYTFRLYHPGWMRSYMSGQKSVVGTLEPEESAQSAVAQFLEDRDWEDRLVMLDENGMAWPF
ncbi:MAG: SDR family oxidoreductase, partial [Eubacteriales bacterium]|nr:SDR family oxidoreductase [Eubacteriales bacterium]